jgi:NADH:ubiquinone oxidoreductase subunit 4 (subunit M)
VTLTILWLLPLVAGTFVAFMPARISKVMSAISAIVTLGIAAGVLLVFDPAAHQYQFTEVAPWVPQLSIFYRLGVDGISIWLVVLNALLTVIAVLATPVTMKNANRFLGLILAMSSGDRKSVV